MGSYNTQCAVIYCWRVLHLPSACDSSFRQILSAKNPQIQQEVQFPQCSSFRVFDSPFRQIPTLNNKTVSLGWYQSLIGTHQSHYSVSVVPDCSTQRALFSRSIQGIESNSRGTRSLPAIAKPSTLSERPTTNSPSCVNVGWINDSCIAVVVRIRIWESKNTSLTQPFVTMKRRDLYLCHSEFLHLFRRQLKGLAGTLDWHWKRKFGKHPSLSNHAFESVFTKA